MKYAKDLNLSTNDIDVIRNAIGKTQTTLEGVKQLDQADASTSTAVTD